MEYKRQGNTEIEPLERIKNFNEAGAGVPLHGLRRTVLPIRHDDRRYGQWLSTSQSVSGMERSGIYEQL